MRYEANLALKGMQCCNACINRIADPAGYKPIAPTPSCYPGTLKYSLYSVYPFTLLGTGLLRGCYYLSVLYLQQHSFKDFFTYMKYYFY